MLFAITKESQIKSLNTRLFKELDKYKDWADNKRVTYPQSTEKDVYKLAYSDNLELWWCSSYAGLEKKRYWNFFGLDDPRDRVSVSITCEINVPIAGINLRTAGIWATDGQGNFFLLHSGKIGGGAKGVGKSLFEREFKGELTSVTVDDELKEYALVGQLGEENLGEQIVAFVKEIARIKSLVKQYKGVSDKEIDHVYSPEYFGRKEYDLPERIVADCNHGLIVSALEVQFREAGIKVFNRHNFLDLYTINSRNKIDRVLEVKTKLSRQVIYTAIGQLSLNTVNVKSGPQKIFVCPQTVKKDLVSDLKKIGIEVLTFELRKGSVRFIDFGRLLKR